MRHIAIVFVSMVFFYPLVSANEADELARIQQKLNAEVMAKPFSVADEAKVDAYIKDAMEKDLKPNVVAPSYWRRGYTCANIYQYSWSYYQDCRYHYRYYGRYWY